MKRIIGGLLMIGVLAGCSAVEEAVTEPGIDDDYSCTDLAEEAAGLESDTGVSLLKVRDPQVTQDNRADYTAPTGADEVVLLQCKGTGVFSNGMTNRVKIEATIDADEDMFVSWQPIG